MSKYRKNRLVRVAYGFSGGIQEEMETFLGFQEIADRERWQILVLHEQFETQLRNLLERGAVDAVVGDFMSASWLESLPEELALVHRGFQALGGEIFSVTPDHTAGIEEVEKHFLAMGYPETVCFSPRRMQGLPWIRSLDALRDYYSRSREAGIFCPSDFLARQAIQLAKSMKLEVPESFGVVGAGNSRLDRLLADTEISSLPMPSRDMGRIAAALLIENLQGASPRQALVRPGPLLSRRSSQKLSAAPGLKSRVDELLYNRLADPPSVDHWAKTAGMSRRSFENAFLAESGVTPYVYLMQLRTMEAKRLLRETDWTIARIGQSVGIPDPPRFSAFFRKNTGLTASEWRRQRGVSL